MGAREEPDGALQRSDLCETAAVRTQAFLQDIGSQLCLEPGLKYRDDFLLGVLVSQFLQQFFPQGCYRLISLDFALAEYG